MNTTKPVSYIRTLPYMSPRRPTWDARRVTTSRYPITTQMTDARATCRPRSISGRARTTMVVSTAVINTPVITTTKASPVRCPVG